MYPGNHQCEIAECGRKAERHHKDGNTRNNDRSNIAFLCNKHHKEADGRMTRPAFRAACSRVGTTLTPEHRAKIGAGLVGHQVSDATRAKLSAAKYAYYADKPKPTRCPHGHAYDEANTRVRRDGRYECRACARARSLLNYYRKRGAA